MKSSSVDKPKKEHLKEIMLELVIYLDSKGYDNAEIGEVFNRHRSHIKRLIDKVKPKGATA